MTILPAYSAQYQ